MIKSIAAKLTRCRHGKALVQIDSEPFNGLESTPAQLLALAESLMLIAHAAVEHNAAARPLPAKRITMEIKNV